MQNYELFTFWPNFFCLNFKKLCIFLANARATPTFWKADLRFSRQSFILRHFSIVNSALQNASRNGYRMSGLRCKFTKILSTLQLCCTFFSHFSVFSRKRTQKGPNRPSHPEGRRVSCDANTIRNLCVPRPWPQYRRRCQSRASFRLRSRNKP